MTEQDPEVWRLLVWVSLNQAWVYAGLLSFITAILRVFVDRKSLKRSDLAEAALCMLITATAKPLAARVGFGDELAFPIGLFIGYAGTAYLKPFILGMFRAFKETGRMK